MRPEATPKLPHDATTANRDVQFMGLAALEDAGGTSPNDVFITGSPIPFVRTETIDYGKPQYIQLVGASVASTHSANMA